MATAMAPAQRSVLREGIVAGLIGAAVVAVWFLFFDIARGRPFLTPGLLGAAVFQGVTNPTGLEITVANVVGYTLIHGLAFIAFGVVAPSLSGRPSSWARRCCGSRRRRPPSSPTRSSTVSRSSSSG